MAERSAKICKVCGYDLRGHDDHEKCSECGTPWLSGPVEVQIIESQGAFNPPAGALQLLFSGLCVMVLSAAALSIGGFQRGFILLLVLLPLFASVFFSLIQGRVTRATKSANLKIDPSGMTAINPGARIRFQPWPANALVTCKPQAWGQPGVLTLKDWFNQDRELLRLAVPGLSPGLAQGMENQITRWIHAAEQQESLDRLESRLCPDSARLPSLLVDYARCRNCVTALKPCSSPDHQRTDDAIFVATAEKNSDDSDLWHVLPLFVVAGFLMLLISKPILAMLILLLCVVLLVRRRGRGRYQVRLSRDGWQIAPRDAPVNLKRYGISEFVAVGCGVGTTLLTRTLRVVNFEWTWGSYRVDMPTQAADAIQQHVAGVSTLPNKEKPQPG